MQQLFSILGTGKRRSFLESTHYYCWLFKGNHWIPRLCFTAEKVFAVGQVVAEFSLSNLCQA